MSYCVNCGVELEKSQQHCPLCGVEAQNPAQPFDPSLPKPYSAHIARVQSKLETRFAAWLVTVLIILAGVVCVMANLVYQNALTWSVYVVASLMMGWILVLLPLMHTGLNPVLAVLLDVCALLAFLYLLNLVDTSKDWYLLLALPQVLSYGLLALGVTVLWRSKLVKGWQRYGIAVMAIGIALMGLEINLDIFNDMYVRLQWSWFVIIPAFAFGLMLFILERKREIKDEVVKRLRI